MADEGQKIEELLQSILEETRKTYAIMVEIRTLLESKPQNPPMDGWVDPSDRSQKPDPTHPSNEEVRSSALVDLCKRLERCYKSTGQSRYIDFRSTRELVESIFLEKGMTYLMNYVRFCEAKWSDQGGRSIGRPERMREQYQAFAAQHDFNHGVGG